MHKIGLFYGSTDGNTAVAAERIQEEFQRRDLATVDLFDVAEAYLDEMQLYDYLILGIPTWDTGQLQRDWEEAFDEFDSLDLSGKTVALFGLGDQHGYANTFADALFFVADKVQAQGARLVGRWPTVGYTFAQSWAADGEHFLGLVLDEVNQPQLSELRIQVWVQQLAVAFALISSEVK
ncbi:MAG TPA: flavodoxin [Caldilineaceae bacterium]|nr:flavodoxin [Caldilineaceae bacterium]